MGGPCAPSLALRPWPRAPRRPSCCLVAPQRRAELLHDEVPGAGRAAPRRPRCAVVPRLLGQACDASPLKPRVLAVPAGLLAGPPLGEKDFVDRLRNYDKDNIEPRIIEKLRDKYIADENFTPENAAKASSAAEGLCTWIGAMDSYDRVAKVVEPKKIALAAAEEEYNKIMAALKVKTFGITRAARISSSSANARCHWPPFSHAEMAAL